jgi:hypothetical protein
LGLAKEDKERRSSRRQEGHGTQARGSKQEAFSLPKPMKFHQFFNMLCTLL